MATDLVPPAVPAAEHELVTTRAGALVRSERALVLVTGEDAVEFLQGQVTNDVEALAPGEGCYAALLNHKGKLHTDMRILRGADWLLLETEPIGLAPLRHTLETYTIGRRVGWDDVSAERRVVSLLGPGAAALLDPAPPLAEHAFGDAGERLHVRTDLGADVVVGAGSVEALLAELGAPLVSEATAECLRIESGRPRLGVDMDGETIPEEAGLNERAVSFTKGCYVGQETVARLHYKGRPNRHLRGLRLSAPARSGEALRLGERELGRLGSACVSPVHGPIALALVRREAEPGAQVSVGDDGATAEVVELPFG